MYSYKIRFCSKEASSSGFNLDYQVALADTNGKLFYAGKPNLLEYNDVIAKDQYQELSYHIKANSSDFVASTHGLIRRD